MKLKVISFAMFGFFNFVVHRCLSQSEDNIVVAQEWEGIFEILLRNEMAPQIYKPHFIQLNKEKLGQDTLLIAGNIYLLPEKRSASAAEKRLHTTSGSASHPIFGAKYAEVPLIDQRLKGTVYYLVSGHGGPDPGALGQYGRYTLSEDEYAYDVTLRLARNLISHGAMVYIMIQDENDGIRDDVILQLDKEERTATGDQLPLNQKQRLKQRADEINRLYYQNKGKFQRLISIHIDSRSKGENIDVFFYHHHKSTSGQRLAREIHEVFKSKYEQHQPGRPYHGTVSSRSSLYMIKNTAPPIVYIELGNIKNYRDQLRFVISDNRQALANWIELGILNEYKKFNE